MVERAVEESGGKLSVLYYMNKRLCPPAAAAAAWPFSSGGHVENERRFLDPVGNKNNRVQIS